MDNDPLLDDEPETPVRRLEVASRDEQVITLYFDSLKRVLAWLAESKMADLVKSDAIAAMTATLFIQRARAAGF
jgi:hypothetical protein